MENYKKGGYEKRYVIRKITGKRIDGRVITKACDPNADYFVLRLDKDPHAQKALATYAQSVEADNPEFASDLEKILYDYGWTKEPLPPQEQWISVDDRLPDDPDNDGESIPVLIVEGFDCVVYEANYEGCGDFCTSMYGHYPTVTYWTPLPPPPKAKG